MRNILIIIALGAITLHCAGPGNKHAEQITAEMEVAPLTRMQASAPEAPTNQETEVSAPVDKKKIIRDGRIGIKVEDINPAKASLDHLVKTYGAYYANENLTNTDFEASWNLKIRIPATNFDQLVTAIENGNGEILYKNVDARDVTEEFVDLETRLENKRAYLQRYRDLLKQAKTIKEILEIEERNRSIEEEIESVTGRLKFLSDQVNFSTLDVMVTQKKPFQFKARERSAFTEKLKKSVVNGWFGLVDFLLFLLNIWPLMIIGVVLFVYRKKLRFRKK